MDEPSEAALNIARRAENFDVSGFALEEIVQAVDIEYRRVVETAEMVAEYLEEVPDAQARILVRLLRDDLAKITPPKNPDELGDEQFEALPDPSQKEREAAIGYLIVYMNPEFGKMVSGLAKDKTALSRGDDILDLDGFKKMLRDVGFRWSDDYFEKHWIELVDEAASRQPAKQVGADPSARQML